MPRLFLGTYLSPEQQQSFCSLPEGNADLAERFQFRIRWVQPAKLHLTWIFLGEVEEASLEQIVKALDETLSAAFSPDALAFDRLELWFLQDAPRHLVLTPKGVAREFFQLIEHLRKRLIHFVAPEFRVQAKNRYRPHVTLMHFEKQDKIDYSLPLLQKDSERHPLARVGSLESTELATSAIRGMDAILPLYLKLKTVELIESKSEKSLHYYRSLRSFSLD